jgi:glycosyltransferase involved in cell wall biosynthesis
MATPPIVFIVPGDPEQRTGGYLYDAQIAHHLKSQGLVVCVVGLSGAFPKADETARQSMRQALGQAPTNACIILDGLAMGGLGDDLVALKDEPHHQSQTWIGLVHHPLADEHGLSSSDQQHLKTQETLALRAVDAVVVTSPFTAQRLVEQGYLRSPPHVVTPGVTPAPLALVAEEGQAVRQEIRWLTVASLTPRKGHDVLLHALSELKDLDWICQWVGDPYRDPSHAKALVDLAHRLGLSDRIEWVGEADETTLDHYYHQAHLSVLPSRYEGYGMVVTEALARGLPVITTDGGALAHTLPPGAGLMVAQGQPAPLASALRQWAEQPSLQRSLLKHAKAVRAQLNDWSHSGQRFMQALGLDTL